VSTPSPNRTVFRGFWMINPLFFPLLW
jgi:hypothetical protein